MLTKSSARRAAWLTLLLIVLAGTALVLAPAWMIQPFRPQTHRDLSWSYLLRGWSPLLTIILSLLSLLLVTLLWAGTRVWWRKAALISMLLPIFALTWLARQNHFEWMFHPLPNAAYARTAEASFVADTDVVMTVASNGDAAAYPVRLMAYHHLVQDVVGGTPLVVTY